MANPSKLVMIKIVPANAINRVSNPVLANVPLEIVAENDSIESWLPLLAVECQFGPNPKPPVTTLPPGSEKCDDSMPHRNEVKKTETQAKNR